MLIVNRALHIALRVGRIWIISGKVSMNMRCFTTRSFCTVLVCYLNGLLVACSFTSSFEYQNNYIAQSSSLLPFHLKVGSVKKYSIALLVKNSKRIWLHFRLKKTKKVKCCIFSAATKQCFFLWGCHGFWKKL